MGSKREGIGDHADARIHRSDGATEDIMRLSYGQVSRLLTRTLKVDGAKAVALTGRLKHFQRTRFPGGTNTGPGPRAVYGVEEVFALVLAFRLLAMRFPPRDAAAAVDANREAIRGMLAAVWRRRTAGKRDDEAEEALEIGPILAGVLPDGLEDLRRTDFGSGPADPVRPVPQRQVWAWMRGVDPLPSPGLVLLDMEAIVAETLNAVDELGLASAIDVANGFKPLLTKAKGGAPEPSAA